jgi:MraZ protein
MTGFFGRHTAKIDDKGRLVIPSAIKSVVPADQMMFVIRKDMYSDCLEMYTWQEWSNMSQAVRSKLDLAFNDEHIRYWRTYMSNTAHVSPDAKLGRISIPKELLEAAGIPNCKLYNMDDLLHDPQVAAGGWLQDVPVSKDVTSVKSRKVPVGLANFSEGTIRVERAPALGEHTIEIFKKYGMSEEEAIALENKWNSAGK